MPPIPTPPGTENALTPNQNQSYEDSPLSPPSSILPTYSYPALHSNFCQALNNGVSDLSSLSASCRLQEKRGAGRGLQGKETCSLKLTEVSSKLKQCVTPLSLKTEPALMQCGNETRCVLTVKKSMMTLLVGVGITWGVGGMISEVILEKGCNAAKFMVDDTVPPLPPPTTHTIENALKAISITPSEPSHTKLSPPYLIPRPPHFPPKAVTLKINDLTGLINGTLRPINAFVKVKVLNTNIDTNDNNKLNSNTRSFTTKVKKVCGSNPTFTADDGNVGKLDLAKDDACLLIQVFDWKPVKCRLLSEVVLPISKFSSNKNEAEEFESVTLSISMRWGVKVYGEKVGTIEAEGAMEDYEGWWRDEEIKERDRVYEIEVERERIKVKEDEEAKGGGIREVEVLSKDDLDAKHTNCAIS